MTARGDLASRDDLPRIGSAAVRARVYPLLVAAIEAGVAYGLHRAYKHTDAPTREQMAEALEQAVINEILERFEIDDEV